MQDSSSQFSTFLFSGSFSREVLLMFPPLSVVVQNVLMFSLYFAASQTSRVWHISQCGKSCQDSPLAAPVNWRAGKKPTSWKLHAVTFLEVFLWNQCFRPASVVGFVCDREEKLPEKQLRSCLYMSGSLDEHIGRAKKFK